MLALSFLIVIELTVVDMLSFVDDWVWGINMLPYLKSLDGSCNEASLLPLNEQILEWVVTGNVCTIIK